ncbi:hypothetical protein EVAR_30829_1 [Eumeta japonica]|uniref:Uncharacterized protein n=1 Tax=Eumeta variegata TaxID=151549 RepID=A0A4C1XPL9_EUMVA|nr:hypothetical protein EVAR_30829_1 [Eumeta japonica]
MDRLILWQRRRRRAGGRGGAGGRRTAQDILLVYVVIVCPLNLFYLPVSSVSPNFRCQLKAGPGPKLGPAPELRAGLGSKMNVGLGSESSVSDVGIESATGIEINMDQMDALVRPLLTGRLVPCHAVSCRLKARGALSARGGNRQRVLFLPPAAPRGATPRPPPVNVSFIRLSEQS